MTTLETQYDKEKFVRFPKMEHFSDNFGIPSENEYHLGSQFYVSEKIDGANLGLYIPINGAVSCFSRSGENAAGGLFKFITDKDNLTSLVEALRKKLQDWGADGIYLWGEYFGQNVCRRIGYKGALGQFRFFDGFIERENENHRLSPDRIVDLIQVLEHDFPELNVKDFFVRYWIAKSIVMRDLLEEMPLPIKSEWGENSNAEGYVISEVTADGLVARWKYKDPAFSDRKVAKKIPAPSDPELVKLHDAFETYFNENRVRDLLSKTTEREKIDVLIRALMSDAREDFVKDNEQAMLGLTEKEKKYIFNVGRLPFETLKIVLVKEKAGC